MLGTAGLATAVVGSGIMAERLSAGNSALALLSNALATVGALYVLIVCFAPYSGAHFNPLVSGIMVVRRKLSLREFLLYSPAQTLGALVGAGIAHLMFSVPLLQMSAHERGGPALMLSEGVASFGLLLVILTGSKFRPQAVASLVASYIGAAYWFTASTSFANPAIALARAFTDSFSGIRLIDVPGFIAAQVIGGALAALLFHWLEQDSAEQALASSRHP
jgi:glycerol uptake facilitator-like aquaporin